MHLEARDVMRECVPTKLLLNIAKNRLKAATGDTEGISGIIRVSYVAATIRFSAARAESRFPDLAAECSDDVISGRFNWKNKPTASDREKQIAREAEGAARASERDVLERNIIPQGWTDRTPDMERWHDQFLQATQKLSELDEVLANLKTELTIRLGEDDGIEEVCSFKRQLRPKFSVSVFCKKYPEKAEQCAEHVLPDLRKRVYPHRAYSPVATLAVD